MEEVSLGCVPDGPASRGCVVAAKQIRGSEPRTKDLLGIPFSRGTVCGDDAISGHNIWCVCQLLILFGIAFKFVYRRRNDWLASQ